MKKKKICRVCGYIIAEDKIRDVCPACGVAHTAFTEYNDKLSAGRRKILTMHFHSMTVHFPQALAVIMFAILIVNLWATGGVRDDLNTTYGILVILLPLTVFGAVGTGIFDAKIRFKRLSPPLLVYKIFVGSIFLLVAVGLALSFYFLKQNNAWIHFLLNGGCVLTSVLLGLKGGTLRGLEVPG